MNDEFNSAIKKNLDPLFTNRQTDRLTDRPTERQTDRQTDRQTAVSGTGAVKI